jgi:formate hydrogenlyase transcriptional activator
MEAQGDRCAFQDGHEKSATAEHQTPHRRLEAKAIRLVVWHIKKKEVRKGKFRRDLWYRLNVFPITVPPLRQHREDIPLLVNFIIDRLNKKLGKQIERIPKSAMKSFMNFSWPGNVRELENVIERAAINSGGRTLRLVDKLESPQTKDSAEAQRKTLNEVERDYILQSLEQTYWRIEGRNGAAAILGLNPSTLRARMLKLGIRRPKSLASD